MHLTRHDLLGSTRTILARLRREEGITMAMVSGVMLVATLVGVAAITAAQGDIPQAGTDRNQKEAYAAAEAGLNNYLYHLDRDNDYYGKCTSVSSPHAVNQRGSRTNKLTIPGSKAKYAIELLPAPGFSTCTNASSMVDPSTGSFRIRSTGYAGCRMVSGQEKCKSKRSIVGSFRRRSFLEYLYFSDYETRDPLWYPATGTYNVTWATNNCIKWKRQGRSSNCSAIQFASVDTIAGPLHTNDRLLVCGSPEFGRPDKSDRIEISDPDYYDVGSWCSNSAVYNTPPVYGELNAPVLQMPPSNSQLSSLAGLKFQGRTQIQLQGSNMKVTGKQLNANGSTTQRTNYTMALPANGLIYVANGTCGTSAYNGANPYNTPTGCADLYLSGNYSQNLTIASDKDVIVAPWGAPSNVSGSPNGNITRSSGSDAVLGLVANNFVRIYHPINVKPDNDNDDGDDDDRECDDDSLNGNGSMQNVQIDAAILTLAHSFIVDNYNCGPALQELSVNGAIAQKFRGPVGTGSGWGVSTGYAKDYEYDDRFKYRYPPYFLDPVEAPWKIQRQNEQIPVPAATGG